MKMDFEEKECDKFGFLVFQKTFKSNLKIKEN